MSKRTRLKFAMVVFFTLVCCAILKNFFPGLDVAILGIAVGSPLAYIFAETKRKSE